ncbi:trypsin-1-like [Artemia franciscana]|uniref:limulus clotting factor C n=1 Tax=Artemia franciscana TaxID=6661 RepID=A0AA88ICT0_ARTSF|nr:hypothetical protein QYM36_005079 [Artemia franciscana]
MFLLCFVFTFFFGHIASRTANVDDLSDIFDPFPSSKTYRSFLDDLDSVFNPLLNVLELQEEEELGPVISPHRESNNKVETNNSETNTGPCDDRCGLSYSNRVVGGQNADIGMFPGYVGIKIRTLIGEIRCGGALIKTRYIITAAHCFHSQNILFATLFFAYSDYTNPSLTGEEQTMVITKKNVIMHENFDKTIWKNDIALIHLERPVTFTDKLIPMCLASGKENLDKVPVIVAGFGTVSKGGHSSNTLRYTRLLTIPNEQCSAWPHMKYVREETICAGAKDRDSCQGDSGGPLMLQSSGGRTIQVGIVSWGIGCADNSHPGVYVRVANYSKWIQDNTADDSCSPFVQDAVRARNIRLRSRNKKIV